ncbi:hypothetical protein BC826DRAFT_1110445 [Russula brevipes]|nr:hypothetical protein BC826DRAFT_1110445 [Russula brevipes]
MPNVDELLWGVGIWHVYAHVNRCFGRYAPIYLKDVSLVDGEILETLWSLLNQVLESCQTMSLASREEMINFHMNDINRKKNMEMIETLIQKWFKAKKLELWNREIDDILEKRITDPGIMDDFLSSAETEPQRAEIELKMQKQESATTEMPGRTKWIIEGIKLQEEQLSSLCGDITRTLDYYPGPPLATQRPLPLKTLGLGVRTSLHSLALASL